MVAKSDVKQLSMALARLLRHSATRERVPISSDGWVEVDDALAWARRKLHINADAQTIRDIVADNDKQRFGLRETPVLSIRANQGHSMRAVELKLAPLNDPGVQQAVHGTYYAAWHCIREQGLSRMRRQHIHLALALPGHQSGVVSGMRSSCEVLVWIDILKATAAGIEFFVSENGVILTEGERGVLRPEFFSSVQDRMTGDAIRPAPCATPRATTNKPPAVSQPKPETGPEVELAPLKTAQLHVPQSPDLGSVKAVQLSEVEKKLRKARKTLREIEELRARLVAGEQLESNQVKKMEKELAVLREIEELQR
jgi:2'-phosphotransferase